MNMILYLLCGGSVLVDGAICDAEVGEAVAAVSEFQSSYSESRPHLQPQLVSELDSILDAIDEVVLNSSLFEESDIISKIHFQLNLVSLELFGEDRSASQNDIPPAISGLTNMIQLAQLIVTNAYTACENKLKQPDYSAEDEEQSPEWNLSTLFPHPNSIVVKFIVYLIIVVFVQSIRDKRT